MLKEFKEFLMRGNIVELAVAVIIGGAFIAAIINFVIVGAVLFLIIKGMNKASELAKKDQVEEAAPAAPTAEDYLKEIRDLLANK